MTTLRAEILHLSFVELNVAILMNNGRDGRMIIYFKAHVQAFPEKGVCQAISVDDGACL